MGSTAPVSQSSAGFPLVHGYARPPRAATLERLARAAFRAGERVFVVVSIFFFSQALLPLLLEESGVELAPGEGNVLLRSTYVAIEGITLLLVLVHWRAVLATVRRNVPTLGLLALALASVLWSGEPDLTLRRSIALAGTTLFGIYLAARFPTDQLLRLVAVPMGIAGLLSLIAGAAVPSYGVEVGEHAGAWRGIFPHKNWLGQSMVLSAAVFLLMRPRERRARWWRRAGFALSAMLVVLSTSKSALAILITLTALVYLFRTLQRGSRVAVPALIVATLLGGVAAVAFVTQTEAILTTMGRDVTLTGRTPIWEGAMDAIRQRPWLGYGYSAFWLGLEGPSAEVVREIRWPTPHAHNGFLDLLLQLGWVGAAFLLGGFAIAVARSFRALRRSSRSPAVWPLTYLSFIVLYNVTETTLLQQNNLYWVLYAAAIFTGVQAVGTRQAAGSAGPPGEDPDPEDEPAPEPRPARVAPPLARSTPARGR